MADNLAQGPSMHSNNAHNPLTILEKELFPVRVETRVSLGYHQYVLGYIKTVNPPFKEMVYECNRQNPAWRSNEPGHGFWYFAARDGHKELMSLYRPRKQKEPGAKMSFYRFLENNLPHSIGHQLGLARDVNGIAPTPSFLSAEELAFADGPLEWRKVEREVGHVNLTGTPLQMLTIPAGLPIAQTKITVADALGGLVGMVQEEGQPYLSTVYKLSQGILLDQEKVGSWHFARTGTGQQGELMSLFKISDTPGYLFLFPENHLPANIRGELVGQRWARGMSMVPFYATEVNLPPSPPVLTPTMPPIWDQPVTPPLGIYALLAPDKDGFSNFARHPWLALRFPRPESVKTYVENYMVYTLEGCVEVLSGQKGRRGPYEVYSYYGLLNAGANARFYKAWRNAPLQKVGLQSKYQLMVLYQNNPREKFFWPPEYQLPEKMQTAMAKHRQNTVTYLPWVHG